MKQAIGPYPVQVVLQPTKGNGLELPSAICLDQIRSIDEERLGKRLGVIDLTIMKKVDNAEKISLGLVDI